MGSPVRAAQTGANSKMSKSKKNSDPSNSISKLVKISNISVQGGNIIFATQGLEAPKNEAPAKPQPVKAKKQRGAYKSFDNAFKSNLAQKQMTKETIKQNILENQKNHLKALINSL
jgi:hypothetical protein